MSRLDHEGSRTIELGTLICLVVPLLGLAASTAWMVSVSGPFIVLAILFIGLGIGSCWAVMALDFEKHFRLPSIFGK